MDSINTASLQILSWLGIYFLHSTVVFILIQVAQRVIQSPEAKEQTLRFALFGPLLTSTIQVMTGWGFEVSGIESLSQLDQSIISRTSTASMIDLYWPTTCVLAWVIISGLLILRHLNEYRSFMQFVSVKDQYQWQYEKWMDLNSDLFVHAGKIEFLFSDQVISPFVHLGNKIVMPELAFKKLDDIELRSTIAHEIAHIERKDWYWLQAYQLIRSVFFFQPLHAITGRTLIRNSEIICDARAVRLTHDQKSLARSILEIATWKYYDTSLVSGMGFQSSFLSDRIHAITDSKTQSRHNKWLVWSILVSFFSICIFTTPVFSVQPVTSGSTKTKGVPALFVNSIPKHSEPYEIDINVPVGLEVDPDSEEVNIDINIENEIEIELNPLK